MSQAYQSVTDDLTRISAHEKKPNIYPLLIVQ